jgi:hypothetical protein
VSKSFNFLGYLLILLFLGHSKNRYFTELLYEMGFMIEEGQRLSMVFLSSKAHIIAIDIEDPA